MQFIKRYLKRQNRKRLRLVMRGYRHLRENHNLVLVQKIKDELSHTPLADEWVRTKKSIYNIPVASVELSARQYLTNQLLYKVSRSNFFIGLSSALLVFLGKKGSTFSYPLPQKWRITLKKYGVDVNTFFCSFLWMIAVVFLWLYGVRNLIIRLRFLLKWQGITTSDKKCIFFAGLSPVEVKTFRDNKSSILSKAIEECPQSKIVVLHDNRNIDNIYDDISFVYNPLPVYKKISLLVLGSTFISLSFVAIRSLFSLLIGRWWDAVLLADTIDARIVSKFSGDQKGNLFFFDQAKFIFRPIWTYTVEKLEGDVILYFYSTNNEYIETIDFHYSCEKKWAIMNWPVYWVWDEYQAIFVQDAVGNSCKIIVKGAMISGNKSHVDIDIESTYNSIAVFDVQPVRDSFYQLIGLPQEYCVPEVTTLFLSDVASVLNEHGIKMLYKSKREIGKLAHHKHRLVINQLYKANQLYFIDPAVSASAVIDRSLATISFPYTSTALLGRDHRKPSVYYDPTASVVKSSSAACAIPVLCGKTELQEWVKKVVNQ